MTIPVTRRVLRRIGLDRNPMRRFVDRVEAVATLVLLAALVVGAPALFCTVGQHVYRDAVADEQTAPPRPGVPTRATVTDGTTDLRYGAYTTVTTPKVFVEAVWSAPDGTARRGLVAVPAGTAAGTTVTVWTDATGEPVEAPLDRDEAVTQAVITALFAVLGAVVLGSTAHLALRGALDRRRLAAWQAEWTAIGPRWTGHG